MNRNDSPDVVMYDPDAVGGISPDATGDDGREYRAHTEPMLVVPEGDYHGDATGMYRVFTCGGSHYIIDLLGGGCDCPDVQHNQPEDGCKHERRVSKMATDDDHPLPAAGDPIGDYFDRFRKDRATVKRHIDWLRDEARALEEMANNATPHADEEREFAAEAEVRDE